MRLRSGLELVLALAVGLAIVHIRMHGPDLRDPHVPLDTLVVLYSSFLTGFVLVEVICLYMEAAWRRSPAIWGTGRLTWALLGTTSLLLWLSYAVNDLMTSYRGWIDPVWITDFTGNIVFHSHLPLLHDLAWLPLAIWLTSRLAGWRPSPMIDGREWAGRAFGVLLVVSRIAVETIKLSAFQFWLH